MKTAFYEPTRRVLVNVQDRNMHHRDVRVVVADLVEAARRMLGPVPGLAFCVWDESSVRIYPMNPDAPPTFDEVATACGRFGYVAG
jgi:hypothetical protein